MAELDTLRLLAGKATPREWAFDGNCGGYITESGDKIARAYSASDAAYIAACDPQTILALLDENERLRAALKTVEFEASFNKQTRAAFGITLGRIVRTSLSAHP